MKNYTKPQFDIYEVAVEGGYGDSIALPGFGSENDELAKLTKEISSSLRSSIPLKAKLLSLTRFSQYLQLTVSSPASPQ